MPQDIDIAGNPTGGEVISLEEAGHGAPVDRQPEVDTTPPVDTTPSTDPEAPANRPPIKVDDSNPDDNTIDFNDFLKAANKPVEPKKDDKKPEVETKPEDKVDEKPPDKVDDKIDKQQQPLPDKSVQLDKPIIGKDGRDYTGVEEADVPHFKKMGNEAFAALKPLYLESKKLKTEIASEKEKFLNLEKEHKTLKEKGPQLPESYYEAEHGYMLDPQFQRTVADFNLAQTIKQHWEQQYQAVAEGAKEISIIDMDPKTGQLYISEKVPATAGSEAKLLAYITHAQAQLSQEQAKVQYFTQTHRERHQQVVGSINDLSQKFFNGFYKTPEDKAIYEPLVQKHLKVLPVSMQRGPTAKFTAEALAMTEVLAKMVNDMKSEIETLKANAGKPANANGNGKAAIPPARRNPTISDAGGGDGDGGKGGEPEITFEAFQNRKKQ